MGMVLLTLTQALATAIPYVLKIAVDSIKAQVEGTPRPLCHAGRTRTRRWPFGSTGRMRA